MTKTHEVGTVAIHAPNALRRFPVLITVSLDETERGPRLSITGSYGNDRYGGGGQCRDIFDDETFVAAGDWPAERIVALRELWVSYHLNDMSAGCEHQRAEGWDERPIDPNKPLGSYGLHFDGQRQSSWNMLVWVRRDEHPEGLLSHPCETCGYRYGTSWLYQSIPADSLALARELSS